MSTPATSTDQYRVGTERAGQPAEIVDLDGDVWEWSTDPQGVPGYRYVGGRTTSRLSEPIGPAYAREYVEQSLYCAYLRSGRTVGDTSTSRGRGAAMTDPESGETYDSAECTCPMVGGLRMLSEACLRHGPRHAYLVIDPMSGLSGAYLDADRAVAFAEVTNMAVVRVPVWRDFRLVDPS